MRSGGIRRKADDTLRPLRKECRVFQQESWDIAETRSVVCVGKAAYLLTLNDRDEEGNACYDSGDE